MVKKTMRKGLGLGKGSGYYNIIPQYDSYVHSLSARGIKSCAKMQKLNAIKETRSFVIDSDYSVITQWDKTSYGFRHLAKLMKNGVEVAKAKMTYYNRTWERYEYQSVIHSLLNKYFPKKVAKEKIKLLEKKAGLYRMDAKGNVPKIKDRMTLEEAEDRYNYELDEGLINTEETPYYDDFNEFVQNLRDMGITVLDAKGKSRYRKLPRETREQLQDLFGQEVPEYLDIVNKNLVRIKVSDWQGTRWVELTPEDIVEYYDTQARNITSGVRKLGSELGDWRNIDALAKETLEIFKIINKSALKKAGKERGMTLKAMFELTPRYDARKSFYGKARVEVDDTNPNILNLYSYNTRVAEIRFGKPKVFGTYSQTTLRHIKEFLKQHGFKAETGKQIMKDYGDV